MAAFFSTYKIVLKRNLYFICKVKDMFRILLFFLIWLCRIYGMCDLKFLDSYQLSLGQYRVNRLSLVITTQYVLHKLFRLDPPHVRHSDKINREPQVIFKRVFYRSLLGLWKLPFISLCLLALIVRYYKIRGNWTSSWEPRKI